MCYRASSWCAVGSVPQEAVSILSIYLTLHEVEGQIVEANGVIVGCSSAESLQSHLHAPAIRFRKLTRAQRDSIPAALGRRCVRSPRARATDVVPFDVEVARVVGRWYCRLTATVELRNVVEKAETQIVRACSRIEYCTESALMYVLEATDTPLHQSHELSLFSPG